MTSRGAAVTRTSTADLEARAGLSATRRGWRTVTLGLQAAALLAGILVFAGIVVLAGCGGRAARIEPAPAGPVRDAVPPDSAKAPRSSPPGATDDEGSAPGRPAGTIHVVRPGETLWRIARTYGVTVGLLAEVNGLADVTRIAVGQRLLIPGAEEPQDVPSVTQESNRPPAGRAEGMWTWPVTGRLSSHFGARRSRGSHRGLDILVPEGTPVVAARDGRVTFSGRRRGYGKVVILEHAGGFETVYAHNTTNLVRMGERVERGEILARSGQTGNATAPHVHFELLREGKALDPLLFLPPP